MATKKIAVTEYKGELKTPAELNPGDPIELQEGFESKIGSGKFGVLTGVYQDFNDRTGKKKLIAVDIETGAGKMATFQNVQIPGVEPAAKFAKLLTGRKGTKLREAGEARMWLRPRDFCPRAVQHTGADPEMFILHGDGTVFPAFEFLPGKKEAKWVNTGDGMGLNGAKGYWDGFQAEFETGPRGCHERHTNNLFCGLNALISAARVKDSKATFGTRTTYEIDPKILREGKEEHILLGCKPSLSVYGDKGEDVPDPRVLPWRFSGGHLHFDLAAQRDNTDKIFEIIKLLDATVGVMGVAMASEIDDPTRRRFYGRAGEYRKTAYGFEYRTLSNFWLFHPAIAHFVQDMARAAVDLGMAGWLKRANVNEDEVRRIINETDVVGARKYLAEHEQITLGMLNLAYGAGAATKNATQYAAVQNLFTKGVLAIVGSNIWRNWESGLGGFNYACSWIAKGSVPR